MLIRGLSCSVMGLNIYDNAESSYAWRLHAMRGVFATHSPLIASGDTLTRT